MKKEEEAVVLARTKIRSPNRLSQSYLYTYLYLCFFVGETTTTLKSKDLNTPQINIHDSVGEA